MLSQEKLKKITGYKGTYDTFDDFMAQNPDYKPQENDLIYCTIENCVYFYDDQGARHEIKVPENNEFDTGVSMYDINKSAITQTGKPMSEGEIRHARAQINWQVRASRNEYYMLLFKDITYYTLFRIDSKKFGMFETTGSAVMECLSDISDKIYSINPTDNYGFEIWVHRNDVDEAMVGYLFPYDRGIVTVGRGGKK